MRKIRFKEISEQYEKIIAPNLTSDFRPSIGMERNVKEYFFINIENLFPYMKQARHHFDEHELQKLAQTIKEYGIRQPLSVIKSTEIGKYEVISGERRLRAAKLVGLEKIPCIIIQDQQDIEEIAIIENLQRSDLHPVELSQAYSRLLENYNRGDQKKLADKLGVSESQISESLKLNIIPEKIRKNLIINNIKTRKILRNIVSCKNEAEMDSLINKSKFKTPNNLGKQLVLISLKNNIIVSRPLPSNLSDLEKVNIKKKIEEILEQL